MTEPTPGGFDTIRIEEPVPGIALLLFDRPAVRNALSAEMAAEIGQALRDLGARDDLRALVLTGSGERAFISGADISELRDRKRGHALLQINNGLFREIERFPRPTIAAVRGWALGGGCELALACDLRVAGEGARFGQPEVGLGILPGAGGTYRLPRTVGIGTAKELIYTGRIIDAAEAKAIGLVNRVVPDVEVVDAALELAQSIAKNSALAVRFAKMAIQNGYEMSTDAAMRFEATAQAVLFEDPEKYERMTAFLERKKRRAAAKRAAEENSQ